MVRRGPLEEFAEGFAGELVGLGYSRRTCDAQLGLLRHLSRWLEAEALAAGDLTAVVAGRFVAVRRELYASLRSPRALAPLLGYLRGRGVAPAEPVAAPATPADALLERFARYLSSERGLAPETVRSYVCQVRPFVVAHTGDGGGWASVTASQVTGFITGRAAGQAPGSVQVRANALRGLLRWMWRENMVSAPLAEAVGSVAAPTGTTLPKALTAGQLRALLTALPADGAARLRNPPMLALMWRLGLRAGEVASLRLDDIDWRAGVIAVDGKRGRHDQMPLPADVGKPLAAYLRRGRPAARAHREVFLALDAPHRPLTAGGVSSVAARALAAAGVAGPGGAHRLRHTAACAVLACGGGLVEAGQLLRQSVVQATAVYAKSDLTALAVLVRPWPAGASR
jgi:site-specific recombinase XerD